MWNYLSQMNTTGNTLWGDVPRDDPLIHLLYEPEALHVASRAIDATVSRTDSSAQLRMPISTLAMIAFNQVSATEAARMGRLDVLEPSALSLWATVNADWLSPLLS